MTPEGTPQAPQTSASPKPDAPMEAGTRPLVVFLVLAAFGGGLVQRLVVGDARGATGFGVLLLVAFAVSRVDLESLDFSGLGFQGKIKSRDLPRPVVERVQESLQDTVEGPPPDARVDGSLAVSVGTAFSGTVTQTPDEVPARQDVTVTPPTATGTGEVQVPTVTVEASPYQEGFRRGAAEETIRAAMAAGFIAAKSGWDGPPEPVVEWLEDGTPEIKFFRGRLQIGAAKAEEAARLEARIREVRKRLDSLPPEEVGEGPHLPWWRAREQARRELATLMGQRDALRRRSDSD